MTHSLSFDEGILKRVITSLFQALGFGENASVYATRSKIVINNNLHNDDGVGKPLPTNRGCQRATAWRK